MPKLTSFKHGKRWVFTKEEELYIRDARIRKESVKAIATTLNTTPRAIQEQMRRIGVSRKNHTVIDEIFNNKFEVLVELSKEPRLTRMLICERLQVSDYFAANIRQIIEVIRAHERLKERGIETQVSSKGHLTLSM